jgi:hypothetical protein
MRNSFSDELLPLITSELNEADFLCFFKEAVTRGIHYDIGYYIFVALAPNRIKEEFSFSSPNAPKLFQLVLNVLSDDVVNVYETFKELYIFWTRLRRQLNWAFSPADSILKMFIDQQEIMMNEEYKDVWKFVGSQPDILNFTFDLYSQFSKNFKSIFADPKHKIDDFQFSMYLAASQYLTPDIINQASDQISQFLKTRNFPQKVFDQIQTIMFMQKYRNINYWDTRFTVIAYSSARKEVLKRGLLDKLIEPTAERVSQSDLLESFPGDELLKFAVNLILQEPSVYVEIIYYHLLYAKSQSVDTEYYKILNSALWTDDNGKYMPRLHKMYQRIIGNVMTHSDDQSVDEIPNPEYYESIVQTGSKLYLWYLNRKSAQSPFDEKEDFSFIKNDILRAKVQHISGLLASGKLDQFVAEHKIANDSTQKPAKNKDKKSKKFMIIIACVVAVISMISVAWISYRVQKTE